MPRNSNARASNSSFDPEAVAQILIETAAQGRDITYSELMARMGVRFSRPKVRSLCKVIGQIDREAQSRGEPELAVLVVRASDRLPGEGWWDERTNYGGTTRGDDAVQYVRRLQRATYRYWGNLCRRSVE
jgi:hypothetical protein